MRELLRPADEPVVLPKPYRSDALVDAVNAAIRGEAASTA
jgi:hypothetical protein